MQLLSVFILLASFSFVNGQSSVPGDYPQASQKILSITDIQELDANQLKLMRNEIFARHGYIFKSADLKSHFTAKSWYSATSTDVNATLSDLEKKNTDLIKKQEERLRIAGDFEDFYALFRDAVAKGNINRLVDLAHIDLMGGESHVRAFFEGRLIKVRKAAAEQSSLDSSGGSASLIYEERLDGDQAEFIVFSKIGSCWYITSFDSAG